MNKPTLIKVFLFIIVLQACKGDHSKQPTSVSRNSLIKVNQMLVEKDKMLIARFIKDHAIDSIRENGAGLYYKIWGNPKGPAIKRNDIVEFHYKVSLLDGTICYQSEGNKTKSFMVGSGGVESGLEQAVLLMHPGQSGKFIMPPHLAFGLLGDNNKIPPRSIIIYDIEMLEVRR